MSINSHLRGMPSAVHHIDGQAAAKPSKMPESNEGFIDAISVCSCHPVKQSSLTTSNLLSELTETKKALESLQADYLSIKKDGRSFASPVIQQKQLEKTETDVTRLFEAPKEVDQGPREIERKYAVLGASFSEVAVALSGLFGSAIDTGESLDTFWTAPGVDFIRLRENTQELTIKRTDQDTIEDRLEINLKANYTLAMQWANAVFGQAKGSLTKRYSVFQVGSTYISVYTVKGNNRVFLEIEGENTETIQAFENMLRAKFTFNQVMQSLYQLFLGDK
jgi:hypothetical protein